MPRRPRIHLDGVPQHIVQPGHNREPCFFGEQDYHAYLHRLGEALHKERCALHAYALMTNHVDLLVTPERTVSIPRIIIDLELNPVRAAMVDNPAHYRWTDYRHNALGQANPYLLPHPLYLALGKDDKTRQATHRSLFRAELDNEAISDIRLAHNQNQPQGNSLFYAKVVAMNGQRREPKPRGMPRKQRDASPAHDAGQGELPI